MSHIFTSGVTHMGEIALDVSALALCNNTSVIFNRNRYKAFLVGPEHARDRQVVIR
jgi:hypothetical protein